MKKQLFSLILIFCSISLYSQWSMNPAVNLSISDLSGEQVLPKVAATSDGGCYIGWFDQRGGGYAVYLQKLNSQGVKQFAADGLLISNNPQSSSLVDWDLAVDDSNCCVLAFTDTRAGSSINPYAYRISPSGQFLWGANGVALTDSVDVYQANPKVIVTSDGNFIIPWQYNNKIAIHKLDKSGNKVWGTVPMMIIGNPAIGTGEKFNYPTGVKSDNGSFILYWVGYTGQFFSPSNYKLYTQKYSGAGSGLWGNPFDTLWNQGNANAIYQPSIYSDGNNGAVYVWQSFITGPTVCYIQRKNSDGQILFPVNGVAATTTGAERLNFTPSASFMPSTGETYMFWQIKNSNQSLIGVHGQRFSSTGARLWTDAGLEVKPLDGNSFASLWTYTRDTSILGYYMEIGTATNDFAKAFKLDRNGNKQWGGSIITPGAYDGKKGRMSVALNQSGMSILAFQDNRNDAGGMYAQNINYDGSFGNPTGINSLGEVPGKFSLSQNYPNPFNPTTTIKFEIAKSSLVTLKVYDIMGREVMSLVNQNMNAGTYEYSLNMMNFTSGSYFYKMTAGDFSEVKKMIVLK
ncbi:MAG: T9SS type A sorting domain-containing protein [Ignavibacteria bacterium]